MFDLQCMEYKVQTVQHKYIVINKQTFTRGSSRHKHLCLILLFVSFSVFKFFMVRKCCIDWCSAYYSEDRIKGGIAKLKKAKGATTQGRLDSFFKVSLSPSKKRKVRVVNVLPLTFPRPSVYCPHVLMICFHS